MNIPTPRYEVIDDDCRSKTEGESSHRSRHLNGNSRSVLRAEHSLNQCAIGLARGPFISSVFSVPNPSSVFLTSTSHHFQCDWTARARVPSGESSHRSQHLNGNRQSVARAEHSINKWGIDLSATHSFTQCFESPIRRPFF